MKTKRLFRQNVSGFTLIEILVVLTLMAIIGMMVTQIFILTTRSQGKSEVLKEVKQNGDYVLSVLEAMVRNAVDVSASCNSPSNTLEIINPDGLTTIFECNEGGNIASLSAYPFPTPSVAVSLISSHVVVANCSSAFRIVCPTPPLSPKYVFINFTLYPFGSSLTPTPGSVFSLDYQTTVSLRKYQ